MSRRTEICALAILALSNAAQAQDAEAPSDRIDILAPPPEPRMREVEECTADQEAAIISGEIVVCRRFRQESTDGVWNKDAWEDRYARKKEPMGEFGMPAGLPIDFVGAGIFKGKASVSLPPPEPALLIDIEALPEAPPGSDADRVARGLAPRGDDGAALRERPSQAGSEEELSLPPPPDFAEEDGTVSPAGSGEPAAPR